jgi:hypothetical protein
MEILFAAKNTALFTSLKPGDVFVYCGNAYMKIKTIATVSEKFNTIQLTTGEPRWFDNTEVTETVKSRLVLE